MSGQRQAATASVEKNGKVLARGFADLGVGWEKSAAYKAFANDFKESTGSNALTMDVLMSKQTKELN